MTAYAELCVTSNFTFLHGASHPEELIIRAAELGLTALAITDRNSVAGVVRAFSALKELHRLREVALESASGEGDDAGLRDGVLDREGLGGGRLGDTGLGDAGLGAGVSNTEWGNAGFGGNLSQARVDEGGKGRGASDGRNVREGLSHPVSADTSDSSNGILGGGLGRAVSGVSAGDDTGFSTEHGIRSGAGGSNPNHREAIGPQIRSQTITDHSSRLTRSQSSDASFLQRPSNLPLPRLIPGARLALTDSSVEWIALPKEIESWSRLTRLLSIGKRRAPKGHCHLTLADLLDWGQGMILIALIPDPLVSTPATLEAAQNDLRQITRRFSGHCYLGATPRYDGQDQERFDHLSAFAQRRGLTLVAMGDVLMHRSNRRPLADVLTCLREGCTIDAIGEHRLANGEHRLKSGTEMERMFHRYPGAVRRSVEIANACAFRLNHLKYHYPDENTDGELAQTRLARLSREGVLRRYPQGVPPKILTRMEAELRVIGDADYARYFLTVYDIVAFARSRGILCQGRGSAANSVVCYLLGITEVPPESITLIFERFISKDRDEPPDIDVDFEHERREEVIQWIYERYGRDRAGLTAVVIHFRARAAIREVGKVMGLSQDIIARLAGQIWGWSAAPPEEDRLRDAGLNPNDRRVQLAVKLIAEIIGFPRHLSQHVGGFVITQGRLDELCPIENASMEDRTIIEWDKDDIDALGLLKVDILALGMLTAIRKAFGLLADHRQTYLSLANVPPNDARVYDMLCRADAIGVFQVESRAQLNFLPRMQPRKFYDLVCEVAIVRPGPIQGGMVHPFINRRQGREKVEDLGSEMMEILGRTYGVPLFQEQAMQIAIIAAGFSPSEADQLRRSLATFKRMGTIGALRDRFISGMLARDHNGDFAARCFAQIEGFGSYGFPESHAASFARLVYVSAWLKCHHQAVFTCALLNAQPMGFYAPAQLVRDARDHGVEIRPVCVNTSDWDCSVELRPDGDFALRLGFSQVKGLSKEDAAWITGARGNGYPDVESLWHRAGVAPQALERLAEADAFSQIGQSRREALWQAKALQAPKPLPLFGLDGEGGIEPQVKLPAMTLGQEVIEDYRALGLSLRAHPLELLRAHLPESLAHTKLTEAQGQARGQITLTGIVITRQRPGTASGVIFLTLEDETGTANVVVWKAVYAAFRKAVVTGRLLRIRGKVQRDGKVTHVIAEHIEDISKMLGSLGDPEPLQEPRAASKAMSGSTLTSMARHPRDQAKAIFPSRDFH